VESHLDHFLHDHLAAEVVTRTVQNKQDAVDYLTWTLFYRRLTQNPNYYNLAGTSHRHVSDHLSDLVERVLADLEASKVIAVEDDMDLEALNLGMIGAYYYIAYTTVELFAASVGPKTKVKGLVEILAAASEYDAIPVRPGEERAVERLLRHAPLAVERPRYSDPHTKVNALLQAHVSRAPLPADLAADAAAAVAGAPRLLQALVDVISSSGWLNPALAAMELSQMVTQALWQRDSPLLQVPGVGAEGAAAAAAAGVDTVFDLAEMEPQARADLLQLSDVQAVEAGAWLARYPDIGVTFEVAGAAGGGALAVGAGEAVSLAVTLEREGEGEVGPVPAPRFPGRKDENWWLVVGDPGSNALLAIKRVALQRRARAKLDFVAPPGGAGPTELTLFLMCDSYLGCDQEFQFALDIQPAEEEEEEAAAAGGGGGAEAAAGGGAEPMEAE
jgi:pre-mRNA-splicing helicase BRR2